MSLAMRPPTGAVPTVLHPTALHPSVPVSSPAGAAGVTASHRTIAPAGARRGFVPAVALLDLVLLLAAFVIAHVARFPWEARVRPAAVRLVRVRRGPRHRRGVDAPALGVPHP